MNNSVYARFCRNTFMKQRIFIRSYCHKTTSTAESKTETANIAESKFEAINLVKSKSDKIELWREKIMIYMKAYEDMFGITKLKEMHEKVVKAQAALRTVQEGRTEVLEEFFQVQKKLHEKRDILHTTPIEDAKYITIMTQVHELVKEQKRLEGIINRHDQNEREKQTALAIAINNSQDYERTYREKNQYLSLITGIVGVALGLVGSGINNWRHRRDIKNFASAISDQVIDLKTSFEKLKLVTFLPTEDTVSNTPSDEGKRVENLINVIKRQHDVLDDQIKSLQTLLNTGPINDRIYNEGTFSDVSIEDILKEFERNIETKLDKHSYMNLGVVSSWALFSALFIFYITRSN